MDQRKLMLKSIQHLTETERLELFNVEELESRLEMAAVTTETGDTNGNCNTSCNQGCVPVSGDAGCW